MADTKKVAVTFDGKSLAGLQRITKRAGLTSAEAVRQALRITEALQDQSGQGYTEIVVRNPATQQERVIVSPLEIIPSGKKDE